MNFKKFAVATVLSFVVMFLLAGLWNGLIVGSLVQVNIDPALLRDQPMIGFIIAGYVVLAVLMSALYPRFRNSGKTVLGRGISYGVMMALLWMLPLNLVLHGVYEFPFHALFMDTGWALVEQGLGGIVIVAVYEWV